MLQAKHRRVLWLLLLIWLQLLHSRLLEKLMDASFRSLQLGSAPGDDLRTLLPCFWLAGALCMVLWQFGSYQRFRRKALESMKPVEESWMRSACEQAALEAGCEAVPPLYQSSSVSTPLVLGFAAPVMLVPEGEYTWAELRMVFLHECTHIRKKDLWYKLIFTAAACILWFQPLLYLLKAAAYRDLEIACDQNVVEGKPEADRKAYADFLLESLRKGRNRELPYSAYFYNSKSVMKARLAVVEDTRVRSGIPGAAVCAALAVLTVLIFADHVAGRRCAVCDERRRLYLDRGGAGERAGVRGRAFPDHRSGVCHAGGRLCGDPQLPGTGVVPDRGRRSELGALRFSGVRS